MFDSHTFKRKELEELYERGAEVLVIGTGTSGVAKWLKRRENSRKRGK